jgi:hypothetical protein
MKPCSKIEENRWTYSVNSLSTLLPQAINSRAEPANAIDLRVLVRTGADFNVTTNTVSIYKYGILS